MYKINNFYDIQKSINSKEIKDKVQIIENKDFAVFLFFDGLDTDTNSGRGISAFNKYFKDNFHKYFIKGQLDKKLLIESNKKAIELNLDNSKFGLILVTINKKNDTSYFSIIGNSAFYTFNYKELTRIGVKDSTKSLLGGKEIKESDINLNIIKNPLAPIFVCSDGFLSLLAKKRSDIVKIINHKDTPSAKAALQRVMKSKNDKNLAYIVIKKKKLNN